MAVAPEPAPVMPTPAPVENLPGLALSAPPVGPQPESGPSMPATEVIPPSSHPSGRKKEPGVRVIEAGAIREAKREAGKPPLVREEIARAKKAALMDLANAYGLDSMGTKEELKERLFAEVQRRDAEERRSREEAERPAPEPQVLATVEDVRAELGVPQPAPESAPVGEAGPSPSVPSTEPVTPESTPIPQLEPTSTEPERPPAQEIRAMPSWMMEPAAETPAAIVEAPATPAPQPEAPPAAVPEAPKVINPCPTCGRELSYLDQYDRYYCYHCKAYAPPVVKVEAVPAPPRIGKPCPTCGRELTFIPDYNRHYCYNCKRYAPLEGKPAEAPGPAPAPTVEVVPAPKPPEPAPAPTPAPPPAVEIIAVRNPCPTCGRELSYIEKYGRFYCYSCKKYAPAKPKNPCPNCGKELTFIAQYQRHYCPSCGQYAPREMTAQILAARSMAVSAAMAASARPVAAAAARTVAVQVHQHASPGGGVGLAVAGLVVLLLYSVLWAIPMALNPSGLPNFSLGSDENTKALGAILQLIGFLMVGLGVIVGLVRLRTTK